MTKLSPREQEVARVRCHLPELGRCETILYAIHRPDTREVKLGVSIDPVGRLALMQGAHGSPLYLIMAIPCRRYDERLVHDLWVADRLEREWFRETPSLMEWVARQETAARALPAVARATYGRVPHLLHLRERSDSKLSYLVLAP